jgi:hypothetical protein
MVTRSLSTPPALHSPLRLHYPDSAVDAHPLGDDVTGRARRSRGIGRSGGILQRARLAVRGQREPVGLASQISDRSHS